MNSSFHGVRPLTSPEYAPLGDVGRTLHWDDVLKTYDKRMLIPYQIGYPKKADVRKTKVLWFTPVSRTLGSKFFGKVTFISDWPSILEKFGPNLYHVDQSIHKKTGYTRVLLTSSTYGSLEKVDFQAEGSAIIEIDGQILHAKESDCELRKRHQLQIAIETNATGGKWLYDRCRVKVEDHSDVNHEVMNPQNFPRKKGLKSYRSYKCFKFYATRTKALLASQCPELLNRIDIRESDISEQKQWKQNYFEPPYDDNEPEYTDSETDYDDCYEQEHIKIKIIHRRNFRCQKIYNSYYEQKHIKIFYRSDFRYGQMEYSFKSLHVKHTSG